MRATDCPLPFQRPRHRIRVSCDDHQQHLRGLVGAVGALLPIPHCAERQVKAGRKLLLRQVHDLVSRK